MGVKGLSKFLTKYAKECSFKDLANQSIAIDTSIFLYKFKYKSFGNDFVKGFLYQLAGFKNNNINPIYVFDGKPPIEKYELKQKRKELKEHNINAINITIEDISILKELFDILHVSYITPETEGEKYCAYLNKIGKVQAVLSNDFDTLVFGCNKLITSHSGTLLKAYNLQEILDDLSITLDELIDVSIASGTDYYIAGIPRMGPATSIKKIKKKPLIEWENIPEDLNIVNLRNIFKSFDFEDIQSCNTSKDVDDCFQELEDFCSKYSIKVSKAIFNTLRLA